jgi:hypothetical protein
MSSLIKDENINVLTGRPVREPKMIEAVTLIQDPGSKCILKVWRKVKEIPEDNDLEALLAINKLPGGLKLNDMINVLGSVENVTRIELLTPSDTPAIHGVNVRYE